MEETVLIDIKVDAGEALKNLEKQKEAQRLLKEENMKLMASQKELIAQNKTSDAAYSANSQKIIENEAKLKNLATQMGVNQKIVQQSVNETKGQEGAYQRLNQEYIVAQQRAKDLGAAYGVESKQAKEAATKANGLNDELKKIDKTVGQSQRGVGEYERGIGGVSTAMGGLPGPIGRAVTSVKTLTKSLWAVIATPVGAAIAAIVAVFALFTKALMSTDEGATKMAGALKAVGNVVDVLLDRTASFIRLLGSLAKLDFEGIKKNASDAFGGIGKSISDATTAGFNYANMMDLIGDKEAAAALRVARLRTEVADLQTAMRNRQLTDEERINAGDLAMKKELEIFEVEKGFQTERTKAEIKNLAAVMQTSKMTMAEKEAQLNQWLAVDDKELESMMEKDKAFADFYNKNEKDIQKIQKMKAADQDKDTELARETRRLLTGLNTLKRELTDEAIARTEEERKAIEERMEAERQAEIKVMGIRLSINKTRQSQLDESRLMDDKYYSDRIAEARRTAEAENDIVDKELKYGVIIREEASLKKYEIEKTYNETVADLSAARTEGFAAALKSEVEAKKRQTEELLAEDERISNANLTNLGNKIDSLNDYSANYIKFQKMYLDEQMAAEIAEAERTGVAVFLIEKKYAKLKENLDRQVQASRMQALGQMFSDIENTFGENTKIAKMAASAQTAIATYQSATESYKALAGIHFVGPVLGGIAAAAAVASGMANIKKIWATQSGLKGDTGGGSTTVAASIPASASVAEAAGTVNASTSVATSQSSQDITSQVAAGVSKALQENPIQPVLVTSDVTTAITNNVKLKNDNSL